MALPLDVGAVLRRGGIMTADEVKQLGQDLTQAKLVEMSIGSSERSLDQPVKIIPFSNDSPASVGGYFTQQKFIWGKTPEEMQAILGIFGKLREGACVLEFAMPLGPRDFETRAYSYLPGGKEYKPNPNEKMYLPGKGAPQWVLKRDVRARCIARLKPREPFTKSTLIP